MKTLIVMMLLFSYPFIVQAGANDYQLYSQEIERCKIRISSKLLEYPSYSGTIYEASDRARVVCENKIGAAPEKFYSFEETYIKRLDEFTEKTGIG